MELGFASGVDVSASIESMEQTQGYEELAAARVFPVKRITKLVYTMMNK